MNRIADRPRAFTLIELLVVVAIISLLISILLPSLQCAREQAKAAKCGVHLRSFGTGLTVYSTEGKDYFPGVNTTGLATTLAMRATDKVGALRRPGTPVQQYDWITPLLRYETDLGDTRAKRFKAAMNFYQCPSQSGLTSAAFGMSSAPDSADFTSEGVAEWAPTSYLMPMQFQWWGRAKSGTVLHPGEGSRPDPILASVSPNNFEAVNRTDYSSKVGQVGPPARKIAAADGTRYLDSPPNYLLDTDISPTPQWFGSFTDGGAWWAGSTAYGVKRGTANWDGDAVTQSNTDPPAGGINMIYSYRHGCGIQNTAPRSAEENKGAINAVFFDGHVARLGDRKSREPDFWYPTGAVVETPSEGMTTLPEGFEIP